MEQGRRVRFEPGTVRIINAYLIASVSLDLEARLFEASEQVHPGRDLVADTLDRYSSGRRVRIEREAQRVWSIQNRLDDGVERENLIGSADPVKGLPPCLRVRKEG